MKAVYGLMLAALFVVGCGTVGGADAGPQFDTAAKITGYLEGKTLTMSGTNIPSHPNGFSENVNFGAATQCYKDTVITVNGGNWSVLANLGVVRGADGGVTTVGQVGTCDRSTSTPFGPTVSTAVTVSNVKGNGECFDFDVTYPSYGQEGRGSITANQIKLELYFRNAFTGIRCAQGNPGASTVKQGLTDGGTLNFTGNSVQTYVITE